MLEDLTDGGYWSRQLTNRRNGDSLPMAIREMAAGMAGRLSGAVWHSPYRSNATWWDFVNIFTEATHNSGSLET